MNPEIEQPSFFKKHKFTLISLFIIVLAAIPLLLLSNSASKKVAQPTAQRLSPTPTNEPLTTQNAAPTLTQMDSTIQNTISQMDSDLKAAQVDSSQDTTSGL